MFILRRLVAQIPSAWISVLAVMLAFASSSKAQAPAIFVTLSSAQGAADVTPAAATTTTINPPGISWAYSAAAPVAGTTWNIIPRPNPSIPSGNNGTNTTGLKILNSANNIALTSATGTPAAATLSSWIDVVTLDSSASRTEPSAGAGGNTVLAPNGLMDGAWRIYNGDEAIVHTVSGLTPARRYYLYVYGSTTSAGQGARFTLNAANVPGGNGTTTTFIETRGGNAGNVFIQNGPDYALSTPAAVNVASTATDTTTWGRLEAVVDGTGSISFRTGRNPTGVNFSNGFQLMPYPLASISVQPPPTPTATLASSVNIAVIASGDGTLTYQWRKDGIAIAGNATATTSTLTLASVQNSDIGSYDVLITNPGGIVTSSAAVLSVTTSAIAPSISTQPVNKTATVGTATSFSVTANGTAPLSIQWQKSTDNLTFANIAGATSSLLTIPAVQTSSAGYYRAIATNSVNAVTSSSASLTVAPVIVTAPASAIVISGSTKTISVVIDVGSGAPEPTTYVWKRDGTTIASGSGISGSTTASLQIASFSAAHSGYYTVTAANSAGSVTSSPVYIGVPSTQTITFAPGNNATGIAIDQQLRLVFPSAPKLGTSGTLKIYDSSNDSVVATIDVAQFLTYIPGNASATIPNAAIRSVQGSSYYYMPVAIYGNEVWVTLSPTQRLSYGKTYYVTMDAALLLDSTNAAYPGVSGTSTWRFSTKSAGPATPTASTGLTTITIAQDGDGDFATFQGAFDWIPQNNTLARTIQVKPGMYRDSASLAQNRNFVTVVGTGANRTDAQLVYPFAYFAPPNSIFTAGSLRIESSDVTVRNLTLDNIIYLEYRPTGLTTSGSAAFAGAINTFATTGNRIVCDNVLIKGGQDTIYNIQGIIYYNNCEVWGSVDFIYGRALAVFDACTIVEIRSNGGPITAPNTLLAQPYGFVFLNCVFPRALIADGYPYDVSAGNTQFQRPWGNDGATAIINSSLGSQITTKGWSEWDGRENTCRAREYGNTLIGGGAAPTAAQRQAAGAYWTNTIDPDYTNAAMSPTDPLLVFPGGIANRTAVTVNPADYTLDAIFGHAYFALGSWRPALAPRIATQPASQTNIAPGAPVTFSVLGSGTPAPTYQWYKNGIAIPGATASGYTIASAASADAGNYSVVLANSAGSTTSSAAALNLAGMNNAPGISTQPASQSVNVGGDATFTVVATGDAPLSYQWRFNGVAIAGASSSTFARTNVQTAQTGAYSVVITNPGGSTSSTSAILGIASTAKVTGTGIELAANIAHPNGNMYDQILLNGPSATVTADTGQVTRTSFVDLSNDIVQIEFSGPGALTITLENATGPALAVNYNQPTVQYMKGHATLTLSGATETTHLSAFTVGTGTAVNQSIFMAGIAYDGVADLALLNVQSPTARLGSIRMANTEFSAATGLTGVNAPGIRVGGPANLHNISAGGSASPVLLTGTIDSGQIGITGGDLLQPNGRAIEFGTAQKVAMLAGATSHNVAQPAQINKGVLTRDGVVVTSQVIQNP